MSKFCGNCGEKMDDNDVVCGKCGTPFGVAPIMQGTSGMGGLKQKQKKIFMMAAGAILSLFVISIVITLVMSGNGKRKLMKAINNTLNCESIRYSMEFVDDDDDSIKYDGVIVREKGKGEDCYIDVQSDYDSEIGIVNDGIYYESTNKNKKTIVRDKSPVDIKADYENMYKSLDAKEVTGINSFDEAKQLVVDVLSGKYKKSSYFKDFKVKGGKYTGKIVEPKRFLEDVQDASGYDFPKDIMRLLGSEASDVECSYSIEIKKGLVKSMVVEIDLDRYSFSVSLDLSDYNKIDKKDTKAYRLYNDYKNQ